MRYLVDFSLNFRNNGRHTKIIPKKAAGRRKENSDIPKIRKDAKRMKK